MPRNCAQFVYQRLKGQIESHYLHPDSKLPSETVLAENFKVSRMTVRKALSQLEAEKMIYCRAGVGSFVKQRVHEPRTQAKVSIGISGVDSGVPEWPYFRTQIYEQIRQSCSLYNCEPHFLAEEEIYTNKEVEAVLIPLLRVEDFPRAAQLAQQKPVILLNRITDDAKLSFVAVDYVEATARIISRLLTNGARKIIYIGGGVMNTGTYYPHYMREQGYRLGHERAGVPVQEELIAPLDSSYRQITEKLAKTQPDVVFISGSLLVLNTITALEVAIPRLKHKPSIFCFDDMQDFSSFDGVPVSCGKMPIGAMCKRAIKHLSGRVRHDEEPEVIHELFPMSYFVTECPFFI